MQQEDHPQPKSLHEIRTALWLNHLAVAMLWIDK